MVQSTMDESIVRDSDMRGSGINMDGATRSGGGEAGAHFQKPPFPERFFITFEYVEYSQENRSIAQASKLGTHKKKSSELASFP